MTPHRTTYARVIGPEVAAMPTEEWRNVPGTGRYIVSSWGRIRNVDTGRILFGEIDRYGYRAVNLAIGGKSVKRRVHRIVAEAFHGPCPDGSECAHLDGDKRNNTPANLAWVPHSVNNGHKRQHGTHQAGDKHPRAKLTSEHVAAIRSSHRSTRALAATYGVNQSTVARIRKGDRW